MIARVLWVSVAVLSLTACREQKPAESALPAAALGSGGPPSELDAGRATFRFDTFGDETFWTDTLRMHEVIAKSVSPRTALSVGLKVDVDALPASLVAGLKAGTVDLDDPATTIALLGLNAVVGLVGRVDARGKLVTVGTTCALCHSSVDNSLVPGIGRRLDGWPNRELNPGAIIALSPALNTSQRAIYSSWGAGRYDPRYNLDDINGPVVIPPAYGLRGVSSVTYTGDGSELAYWNRYVAVTQMHGHGTFAETRTGVNIANAPDLVGPKLRALQFYQLSLDAPRPARESFDSAAAERGRAVFAGVGKCSACHVGANLTDAPDRLHAPSEVVSEPEPGGVPSYAGRSATRMYRTTPLRGLAARGPYFHNGSAATLDDVVTLYDKRKNLRLTAAQKADLVQYLKSL